MLNAAFGYITSKKKRDLKYFNHCQDGDFSRLSVTTQIRAFEITFIFATKEYRKFQSYTNHILN